MKAVNVIRQLIGAVAVIAACNAYAQPGDTGTTTSAPMAAPMAATSGAKSIRAANRKLEKDVRQALTKTKRIDVSSIHVAAKSGAVTLTGNVPDSGQSDLAAQTAQRVAGVTSVKNWLSIGKQGY